MNFLANMDPECMCIYIYAHIISFIHIGTYYVYCISIYIYIYVYCIGTYVYTVCIYIYIIMYISPFIPIHRSHVWINSHRIRQGTGIALRLKLHCDPRRRGAAACWV